MSNDNVDTSDELLNKSENLEQALIKACQDTGANLHTLMTCMINMIGSIAYNTKIPKEELLKFVEETYDYNEQKNTPTAD